MPEHTLTIDGAEVDREGLVAHGRKHLPGPYPFTTESMGRFLANYAADILEGSDRVEYRSLGLHSTTYENGLLATITFAGTVRDLTPDGEGWMGEARTEHIRVTAGDITTGLVWMAEAGLMMEWPDPEPAPQHDEQAPPNVIRALHQENKWGKRRKQTQAEHWVTSTVETAWLNARYACEIALGRHGGITDPLVDLRRAVDKVQSHVNALAHPPTTGVTPPHEEQMAALKSPLGLEAKHHAAQALTVAREALAWAENHPTERTTP